MFTLDQLTMEKDSMHATLVRISIPRLNLAIFEIRFDKLSDDSKITS